MPNKNGKSIIDVIPLTRLSLSNQQYYSYLNSKPIPRGSLVSISLFRRDIKGVVIKNRSDFHRFGNIKLKKVNKIIATDFLTENQLELANFISDYYLCPLGISLKSFVPRIAQVRKLKKQIVKKKEDRTNLIRLTAKQENAIDKISKGKKKYTAKNSKYLLYGPASSGKTEVYIESIKRLSKDAQVLILVPELTLTPQAIERYGDHFDPEKIAILTSKISKGKFYENWQNIKSGKSKIIIGTRIATLAPFRNLKLIVIDEEQDMSFKQWDMHPRYDARTISEELAKIFRANIIRGSATPSIESYFKAENGKYIKLELDRIKNKSVPEIEIADMRKEKWKKNYSPISNLLRAELSYALKNKLQTILFINRQGMSAFSICSECKTVLKCPECDRALIYTDSGNYNCLHCNFKSDILSSCQKCHGIAFRNIGLGTQKVEKVVNDLFSSAKVKRADFESMKKSGQQDKLYKEFSNKEIDILIGTQMITKGWDLPNVGLIGIIDADSMLDIPDFRTNERAFQHVLQVSGRTGRVGSKFHGKVILQTFDPKNETINFMAEMNFRKLYDAEISEREIFNYPPFGKIIKLTHRNRSPESLKKTVLEIYSRLSEIVSESKNFKISIPQDPLVPKVRGMFKKQLVLIQKGEGSLPPKIANFLKKLSSDWIIDVDPISIV